MGKLITLLCGLLFLTSNVAAQHLDGKKYAHPLIFKHLTKEAGLASNTVNCILQDRIGYMWFGTKKGLNRYDGRSFITFQYNPKDPNSISGNEISELFEDRKGRLWIGTADHGLTMYDQVLQKFRRYEHNDKDPNSINNGSVNQIYEDKEGRFWICLNGGGLELFDGQNGKFIHHVFNINDTNGLAGNKVKAIYETAPGKYLVGTFETGDGTIDKQTWGHINQYDIRTNKFEPLKITGLTLKPTYRQGIHIVERLIQDIKPDALGNIWFASYVGILKYDPHNNTFKCYENDETDPVSLSLNTVESVCEYNGSMYFGTHGGGICVLDSATGTFTAHKNDPLNVNSLSDNIVRKLYKDRENRLWIATMGGGVSIVEPPEKDFILYTNKQLLLNSASRTSEAKIRALCKGNDNDLYVGSDMGLSMLNTVSDEVNLLQFDYLKNGKRLHYSVSAITPSANGKFWLGTDDHIIEVNREDLSLPLHNQLIKRDSKFNGVVYSLLELDRPGNPLFVSIYYKCSFLYYPGEEKYVDTLPRERARLATLDNDGSIWCYNYNYLPPKKEILTRIDKNWHLQEFLHDPKDTNSVSSNTVRYIYRDKKDRIWIITDKGLDRYERQTGRFTHFKNIENFSDSTLNCMIEDSRGNMWFITDEALIKLNPETKIATTYTAGVDLPVHKLEDKMVYDTTNDALYFTANEGIVAFHPGKLKLSYNPPPLFITDIKLFNKIVFFDSATSLKRVYRLPYNKNFITIDFTALNYAHPEFNQYAYKMEGLNQDWNYIGNSHEANFTDLAPGTYTFKLKGSSRDGIWDQHGLEVIFIISPPWWKTGWFYFIASIVIISSFAGYTRYRVNIFKSQNLILEKIVESRTREYKEQKERAEESEQFKQQFLANMSHEIRTPMNAVSGMTDILLDKDPRPDQMNYLTAINKSSDILLHIIDDILDFSKIEAGKLELENIEFSLSDTIGQVRDTLSYRAEEKGLELIIDIDKEVTDVIIGDPFRLNQVLVNLVGNALKFTERGRMQISVKKLKEEDTNITLAFSVSDTGIGIPQEKLHILFESFTQVHNSDSRKYAGTGLGLAVSKKLVELQGGSMSVKSNEGEGSTFSFVITYAKGSVQKLKQRLYTERKIDAHILDGLKILLAEDNEYNRLLVNETLFLKANLHIDIAVNGEEAVRLVSQNDYDLVLMDVQMPLMSGLDATRYIRKQLPAPKNAVPIIAFTASILRSDLDMCTRAGMNAYIPKPFKAWQLINTIADVSGRRHNQVPPEASAAVYPEEVNNNKNAQQVTDLSFLAEYCEGDEKRMKMYVQLYLQAVPVLKEKVTAALAAKDMSEIAMQMHSFKPKWAMMGMKQTAELGKMIEALCKEPGNEEKITGYLSMLLDQSSRSVTELAGTLNS